MALCAARDWAPILPRTTYPTDSVATLITAAESCKLLGVVLDAATEVSLPKNPNALLALLWAGFACGALDLTAALVVYGFFGLKPMRLLQGIASGLLGTKAFSGGIATAVLGVLCHFLIAFAAAAVYLMASRVFGFLVEHAVVSGILYGVAVYFFMNRIVLPLSAAAKRPFSLQMMLVGVVIHIFCVGLPIALSVRRFSR